MANILFKNFSSLLVKTFKLGKNGHLNALSQSTNAFDMVVVGAGIIGMASAYEIQMRHPKLRVAVLDKEPTMAMHQTAHSCGVVHAGIYYKPGSMTANLCVKGMDLLYKYCEEKGVPHWRCGKLIVATNEEEETDLQKLYERGLENGAPDIMMINDKQIKEIEPHCCGRKALWSPQTGCVDFAQLTHFLSVDFQNDGGHIFYNFKVTKFAECEDSENTDYPIIIFGQTDNQVIRARNVLTCCGLQADLVAQLTGCNSYPRIVPFRAEYMLLADEKADLVRGNIYAVPNPRSPALGIHFTPHSDGNILLGPRVIPAFKREGYKRGDIDMKEFLATLSYPGFQKFALKYMRAGITELSKSIHSSFQTTALQKYLPELTKGDVRPGPTGLRAQALDLDGNMIDDLMFDCGSGTGALDKNVVHLRSVHWPGATSSLAIAKLIADRYEDEFSAITAIQEPINLRI